MNFLSSLQENAAYYRENAKNMMVIDNKSDSDEDENNSDDSVERERNRYLRVKKSKKKEQEDLDTEDSMGFDKDTRDDTPVRNI